MILAVRVVGTLSVAVALLAGGVSAAWATNAPHVQQRIEPGKSIGKVALGMTLHQVRKALGPPESVIEKRELGFGKTWIEYSWNFTEWRVALVNGRVVSVGTSARTERTREGIGIGTTRARVVRTYRIRDCLYRFRGNYGESWCVVSSRGGARTAFVIYQVCEKRRPGLCDRWGPSVVREVYVLAAGEALPGAARPPDPTP